MTNEEIIKRMKRRIVNVAHRAGGGHIPSAFSILDIVWALYNGAMNQGDVFILSKGHGSLALYAVLEEKKLIADDVMDSYGLMYSLLGGHPDRNKVPGVKCSTGSLGHGLPQAVGIALAMKIKGSKNKVYCLVGDGELNEGSCWEALLLAEHHKLTNLMVIVDNNHSTDRALSLGDLSKKLVAFGFFTYQIHLPDVHKKGEPSTLSFALNHGMFGMAATGPQAVIANTRKGSGCKRMEDPAWHHRAPNDQELEEILKELE